MSSAIEAVDSQNVYFEVVSKNIGRKRTVPVSIGAGQKLPDSDHAVYVHDKPTLARDGRVLLPVSVSRSSNNDEEASYILSGCSVDAAPDDLGGARSLAQSVVLKR